MRPWTLLWTTRLPVWMRAGMGWARLQSGLPLPRPFHLLSRHRQVRSMSGPDWWYVIIPRVDPVEWSIYFYRFSFQVPTASFVDQAVTATPLRRKVARFANATSTETLRPAYAIQWRGIAFAVTRPKATSASDASPVIMATHDRSVLFLTVLALGLRFIIEGPRKPLKVVRCAGFVVLGAKVMEAKVEEMDRFDFCLLVEEVFDTDAPS